MADIKISDEQLSKIVGAAITLQLDEPTRQDLIGKALSEYLLAKATNYTNKTRIQETVERALDAQVRLLFDELLAEEPYKTKLREAAEAQLKKLFVEAHEDLHRLVSAAIGIALTNNLAQAQRKKT